MKDFSRERCNTFHVNLTFSILECVFRYFCYDIYKKKKKTEVQ